MEWQTRKNESLVPQGVGVQVPPLRPVKYSKELLEETVKDCLSIADVLRKLDLKRSGGSQAHIGRRLKEFGIDTSHFLGQAKNRGFGHKGGYGKVSASEVLSYDRHNGKRERSSLLKRALIESGVPEQCAVCSLKSEWNGKPLVLQVDHIDGEFLNNRKENLRFLCPNCHSQTETFGRKNG